MALEIVPLETLDAEAFEELLPAEPIVEKLLWVAWFEFVPLTCELVRDEFDCEVAIVVALIPVSVAVTLVVLVVLDDVNGPMSLGANAACENGVAIT